MKLSILTEYLFNTKPLSFSKYGTIVLFVAIFALTIPIIINLKINRIPVFYKKLAFLIKNLSLWYGSVMLFLYFVRIQRIPYFSMRIWLWGWVIVFLLVSLLILYKEWKKIPQRKAKVLEQEKRKRYFE